MVESTRLLEQDESGTIERWRSLISAIERSVLPKYEGRLVNSLGDGLLLDFHDARSAVSAAFDIQNASNEANETVDSEHQICLRMGLEVGDLLVDQHDVYGRGAMVGQRLMTLARPGEIVVSTNVRDSLTPSLDAEVEDLGECYVKHAQHPLRAYRIGPPGHNPVVDTGGPVHDVLPLLAVVPFSGRFIEPDRQVVGEVLAEEMIRSFSRSSSMNVVSRLSTTAFRDRNTTPAELRSVLKANFVLSGAYSIRGERIVLSVELAETKNSRIVWADRLEAEMTDIVDGDQEVVNRVVADVSRAVATHELKAARSHSLPTLESYTLLMGAITLMHRNSLHEFEEARTMLEEVAGRASRQSLPHAWMGKWYVLRAQQGWTQDPDEDARRALDCTHRALDADPDSSLALTVDGFVHTNLLKKLDVALESYDRAVETNPNDSLAWLGKGTLHAFVGEGEEAMFSTDRALRLSPFDPLAYFYYTLAGTAQLAAHRYDRALELAKHSLRANRVHTSTYRVKAIAEWHLGLEEDARTTVAKLLELEPGLTINRYLERSPAAPYATGKTWSEALRGAGVPQ